MGLTHSNPCVTLFGYNNVDQFKEISKQIERVASTKLVSQQQIERMVEKAVQSQVERSAAELVKEVSSQTASLAVKLESKALEEISKASKASESAAASSKSERPFERRRRDM
jgi:uncharacterized membrane protein YheB (UPF0754 family)